MPPQHRQQQIATRCCSTKILVFLIILVIGWIVARVLARVVDLILRRVHFDRFVERGVVGQALARSHTDATSLIARIASILIIVLGAIAALNQVGIAAGVTQPVLWVGLLTAGAVVAIGVGGGLIKPMQERWERMLNAAERETSTQLATYQAGRTDAMRAPAPPRPPEQEQAARDGAPGHDQDDPHGSGGTRL
jgi:hypothetical protein